ncbi:hypothetical protein [Fructilactobacillus fructivorans]|uniref:Uncharacterized protein n=1 Tax=Fructilactobacillus fructivorans TaxID=1614 RepID=A0AAE6P0T9_9LACO|nr:hypothetical protein [Fructilactobacillus fructivorans]KRK57214.1 hypothetical protein FC73_GL001252 [Fructilactobacillus fructivorans]KRN40460.1 hypothetical protein IV51_GL000167 [Fructilactobacillus fructivorans]KRN42802.1 hypothetical protein IV48_GL001209 [Fructilactobacillus fructivorans]QFX92302.1 hypothetical protein LF543_01355 [Fructilactobacillus fructivorans]RDV64854.1 hypothetical protein DXU76_05100 [Fructilactobacillus fructivorans]
MVDIAAKLITVDQALAMLKDRHAQKNERFPKLMTPGKYILPDYFLTRKREAFKIRKHTFLKRRSRSYVAFDSENGQTLWLHNFPSLSEALFWLDTGLKPADSDSGSSFKEWKQEHAKEIEGMKDQLRQMSKPKKRKPKKAKKGKKH